MVRSEYHLGLDVKRYDTFGFTIEYGNYVLFIGRLLQKSRNSQMCIVTGPNQDIAIKLIKRMKGLFEPKPGNHICKQRNSSGFKSLEHRGISFQPFGCLQGLR